MVRVIPVILVGAGLFVATGACAQQAAAPGNGPRAGECGDTAYRALDFWIGDWDVFDADRPGKRTARVRVERILDGCARRERYRDERGLKGESISSYDATRQRWQQTWVTNHGQLLVIEGGERDGAVVLEGADQPRDGTRREVRGTWKAVSGGVRETAVTSIDGGKSWQPWFDLMFRPHLR